MKTLFKRDSKGKIRTWTVEITGNQYRTTAGLDVGDKVTSQWTATLGKNIGKKNQLTPDEQAVAEVEAMYVKKIKEGYFEDITLVDTSELIKPMLAEVWDGKLIMGHQRMFEQPKLDGLRANVSKNGTFSRKGDKWASCPHIEEALVAIFNANPDVIFDGEFYNHDLKDNFNKIVSLVKKKKPTAEELLESERIVEYHVYDLIMPGDFATRYAKLQELVSVAKGNLIKLVETTEVKTTEELDAQYEKHLEAGYEGQMVRLNNHYQHKRSQSLLKRKEFQDAEFEIAAIEEGIGNRSGMAGRVTCILNDGSGRTFGAGIKGGLSVNGDLWSVRDSLVGKKATIKFFNYTPAGIPRFPVYKDIREDV